MYSDDTTDDSGQNLMHQTNEKKLSERNYKVTQHDTYFENSNDEDNLEAPHRPIIYINFVEKNARISQSKIVLEVHSGSRPCSSFDPLDSNCTKQ